MKKILLILMAFSFAFAVKAQQLEANAAKQLVIKNSAAIGMSATDLQNFRVNNAYTNEGVQMVYLNQDYKGLPIFNQMRVLQFKNGEVTSNAGAFLPDAAAASRNNSGIPSLNAMAAVQAAFSEEKLSSPLVIKEPVSVENGHNLDYGILNGTNEKVTAKLLWVPIEQGKTTTIKLAWQVQVAPSNSNDLWLVNIDANTGAMINKMNLTVNDSWDKNPVPGFLRNDGIASQQPSKILPALSGNNVSPASPNLVGTVNYLVIPFPAESPTHPGGTPAVRTNPWTHVTGSGSALGWHFDGTTNYTISRGNNVWATEDQAGTNTSGGPIITPTGQPATSTTTPDPLNFNFAPNFATAPNTTQNQQFTITNLFYWNNNMHDMSYQYGFNEASANFQNNNQGLGGTGNDYVIALAQSTNNGAIGNNANFRTPAEGGRGRMCMYLFNSQTPTLFHVNTPAAVAGDYYSLESGFSTANKLANVGPVTGQVVWYNDDAAGSTHYACNPPVNSVAGKIALINRGFGGICTAAVNFTTKVLNAQNAGAIAVIVVNNVPANIIAMGGTDNTITIPAVMISQSNGATLAAQIGNNLNVTLSAGAPTQVLDGDLDAGVMCHEYTHGISNRFTGGGSGTCLGNAEQGGEGWSDYFGLMMTQNWPAATLTTGTVSRGIGTYVEGQPYTGPGIRNYPYSTDITINPLTYADMGVGTIGTEVHNIGEIWCMALWEMTWQIIQQQGTINTDMYTFTTATTTGGNSIALKLVLEGMRLQPCQPGYIDARDAILKADRNLYCGAHACSIWTAFAKRGMGYGASQGSSNSATDQVPTTIMPPAPTVITSPNSQTVAAGANVTFTANAGTDVNLIYQWQVSTDGGTNWTDISCQILPTYTITGVTAGMNGYKYRVKAYIGCLSSLTSVATLTVTSTNPAITLTSAAGTNTQSVCLNTAIVNIVYATTNGVTGVTLTGSLPAGVTGAYSGGTNGTYTISGTPTASGTFNYTLTTTGGTPAATASGTITVNTASTVTLTSGSNTQTVCQNTAIANIVYTVGNGATGATAGNLPAGVTGTYSGGTNGTYTISGTPTASGTFNYTVTTSGGCSPAATLSGTITVTAPGTVTLTSAAGTNNQSVNVNTPIANITYSTAGGITGAAVGGLPTGVTGVYNAGTITISGTPTIAGTFNYTITTTGGCGATATGTITVTTPSAPAITLTSAAGTNTQTVCRNTAIINITYSTANGVTGVTLTGALPAGVTGVYSGGSNGTYTISGTPTAAGTFNYTLTTSGGTGAAATATGTITVNAPPAAPTVTTPVTYCQGSTATPLTATGTNLLWYTTATGGTGSATAPTPSTATVGSTTYYVSSTVNGCEGPRAAIVVTVNVTPGAPTVTSPVNYCLGATAVPLTATGTNLLWYTTATGGTGSATAPTPSTATAGSTTYYVSQTTGSCEGPRAAIVVNVAAGAAITSQPSDITSCATTAVFTVVATGTNLSYQWQVSTDGGNTYSNIPGANSATLTLTGLTPLQSNYKYRVLVTAAGCGAVISNAVSAHIGVTPSVVLTAAPTTVYNPSHNGGLFTTVSPIGNYTYQWKRDGVILPVLGPQITAANGLLYDFGTYVVTVFDVASGCSGVSNAVTIVDDPNGRSHLFISPSPTTGPVQVSFYSTTTTAQTRGITVYDSKGAEVMVKNFTTSGRYAVMNINLGGQSAGVYMIILRDASGKRIASGEVIKF